ncbi:MAG TPA: CehA/McbA family metallohydrolase, partial [Acidobacteriota bacterium]|nr:CehA/McbA family metallohydrolase [Acidobacteriota bacterium]
MLILWVVLQAVSAAPAGTPSATIVGRVVDAGTGRIVPCTVAIRSGDGQLITDHESFRAGFRSAGEFVQTVPPGEVDIKISRGFDFIAIERKVQLQPGERYRLDIALRRRSPLRREGWYVGDNHDHMIHGERKIVVDFEYAALAARAEGLDYLALAQHWNVPTETPEALGQACERSSTPDFLLTWNLEAPKNYWRGDVSKCLGHGWTVGMRGRTDRGDDAIQELMDLSAHDYESAKEPSPNFDSHALIHELGGIVSYSHPCRWWWGKWGGTGIYPVEERKFVSNMAAELPFDTVAGPTYDAIDILMQPHEGEANDCAQKLWFMLLDKGYHIAATGSSDATFDNPGGGVPGAVRIYTKTGEPFSLAGAARAIREGRSFVTTGPLIVLEVA